MREEVFKVVNLFERYQSWVAVRIAAGEELFLFLLLTGQGHRPFSFNLLVHFFKQLAESFENRLTIKNLFRSFFALSKNKNTISQIRVLNARVC